MNEYTTTQEEVEKCMCDIHGEYLSQKDKIMGDIKAVSDIEENYLNFLGDQLVNAIQVHMLAWIISSYELEENGREPTFSFSYNKSSLRTFSNKELVCILEVFGDQGFEAAVLYKIPAEQFYELLRFGTLPEFTWKPTGNLLKFSRPVWYRSIFPDEEEFEFLVNNPATIFDSQEALAKHETYLRNK